MSPTRTGNTAPNRGPGRPVGTDSGRTREHLLSVARDVLAEAGFPRTTIREIAERANVNPALLHYYFGNKSGLHTAVVEQLTKRIQSSCETIMASGGPARDQLRSMIREYILALSEEPYVPQMLIHHVLLASDGHKEEFLTQVGAPLLDGFDRLLSEGIAAGELRDFNLPFLLASLTATCLAFFLAGPLIQQAGGFDSTSRNVIESWANSAADLILDGLSQ